MDWDFSMVIIYFVFVLLIVLPRVIKTSKKQASRKQKTASAKRSSTVSRGYDKSSLDYCDSHVSASQGITFRGLPEGADELAYLSKFNSQRERELERDLKRQI